MPNNLSTALPLASISGAPDERTDAAFLEQLAAAPNQRTSLTASHGTDAALASGGLQAYGAVVVPSAEIFLESTNFSGPAVGMDALDYDDLAEQNRDMKLVRPKSNLELIRIGPVVKVEALLQEHVGGVRNVVSLGTVECRAVMTSAGAEIELLEEGRPPTYLQIPAGLCMSKRAGSRRQVLWQEGPDVFSILAVAPSLIALAEAAPPAASSSTSIDPTHRGPAVGDTVLIVNMETNNRGKARSKDTVLIKPQTQGTLVNNANGELYRTDGQGTQMYSVRVLAGAHVSMTGDDRPADDAVLAEDTTFEIRPRNLIFQGAAGAAVFPHPGLDYERSLLEERRQRAEAAASGARYVYALHIEEAAFWMGIVTPLVRIDFSLRRRQKGANSRHDLCLRRYVMAAVRARLMPYAKEAPVAWAEEPWPQPEGPAPTDASGMPMEWDTKVGKWGAPGF